MHKTWQHWLKNNLHELFIFHKIARKIDLFPQNYFILNKSHTELES